MKIPKLEVKKRAVKGSLKVQKLRSEGQIPCVLYGRGKERGYQWAEFSWTLEDNRLINAMIKNINCLHYKTYRIYEKALRR